MFARLYTNNVDVKTAYSELSKVIAGAITSPASLTAFNSSTSTIDATQPSNWAEYTTVGATNNVNAGTAIWFRQRNRAGRWKYAAVYRTTSPTNTHKGLLRHYTVDSPSVLASVAGVATNNSEAYGATTEYTVAAGPGYLVVATRLTTSTYFTEAHMWLEYPETESSSYLTLPNHVLYRHFTTGGSYATDATTDIAYSTGIVECAKPGNADVQVLNGGMSAPATTHGTMKPSYFTSFTSTLDSSGNFVAHPFLSLFYESPYQGLLDCSSLTNVWGTGTRLGTTTLPAGTSLLTCASSTFEDLSDNGFTVTAAGNTVVSASSPFTGSGWSNFFDGNGDYLTVPNNSAFSIGAGNFTVEAWIRLTAYPSNWNGNYYAHIISQDETTGRSFVFQISGTASSWTNMHVGLFTGASAVSTSASFNFALNTWYHIAYVRSGTSVRMYVNGTDVGGGTNGTNANSVGSNITIGAEGPTWAAQGFGYYFPGYISNLRFVKGTALYTGNFTPSTTPYSALSNFLSYGEGVTINGSDYAYLKANGSMSYLVPKR